VQLKDAYATLTEGEVWLHNMHIAPYQHAPAESHEPERPRKLRGEWWSLNEEGTALVGEESGRRLGMGDPVRVEVAKVFAPRGRVDLLPIMT